jgi:hypothetical protein
VRQGHETTHQLRASPGHPHVGDDECRPLVARHCESVVAGGHPTDDAEVGLLIQQRGERGPDPLVVVRDDDGDLTAGGGRHRSTLAHSAPLVLMRRNQRPGANAPRRDTGIPDPGRVRLGR